MRTGLAIITKYVRENISVMSFLENARKYGRKIEKLIIVYSHGYDQDFVKKISEYIDLELVRINRSYELEKQIKRLGIKESEYKNLLHSETLESHGLVEYGKYRNIALLKALIDDIDVLFFVDTDVYPKILTGENEFEEVDFFGRHLDFIRREYVHITTSDYSGYYIIPPMKFDLMEEFFEGIQKKSALHFIKNCKSHGCINFGNVDNACVDETDKLLGGNLAIKTSVLGSLPPFFSTTYMVDGELVLTRGEDTLMGICAREKGVRSLDIDLLIFHDTYGKFPNPPQILKDKSVRDRFYYACTGWIGRNTFLNYMNGCDFEAIYEWQRSLLEKSACEVACYLNDERFSRLVGALDSAYGELPRMVDEYECTLESFGRIVRKISGGEGIERSFGEPLSSGRIG